MYACLLCCAHRILINAWGHYGAVLYDPKTNHIVRLLGDRHYSGGDTETKIQHRFDENIRKAFGEYMQCYEKRELCVIEAGVYEFYRDEPYFKQSNVPVISFDFRESLHAHIGDLYFLYFPYKKIRMEWNIFLEHFKERFEKSCCDYDDILEKSLMGYRKKIADEMKEIESFFVQAIDNVGFNHSNIAKKSITFYSTKIHFR